MSGMIKLYAHQSLGIDMPKTKKDSYCKQSQTNPCNSNLGSGAQKHIDNSLPCRHYPATGSKGIISAAVMCSTPEMSVETTSKITTLLI